MKICMGVLMVCQVFAGCTASPTQVVFSGMSDASAAVALDAEHFVVTDDENNTLRIYRSDQLSAPVKQIDLTAFLCVDDRVS